MHDGQKIWGRSRGEATKKKNFYVLRADLHLNIFLLNLVWFELVTSTVLQGFGGSNSQSQVLFWS